MIFLGSRVLIFYSIAVTVSYYLLGSCMDVCNVSLNGFIKVVRVKVIETELSLKNKVYMKAIVVWGKTMD